MKYLTIAQIKSEYGINRKVIDDAIHSGELPAYQFAGKTKQIKVYDLDKWIERKRYTPAATVPLIRSSRLIPG
jgi:excisionase family DNA binding protein